MSTQQAEERDVEEARFLTIEEKRQDPHVTCTANKVIRQGIVTVWGWRERYLGYPISGKEAVRLYAMDHGEWVPVEYILENMEQKDHGRRHSSLGSSI